MRGQPGLRRRRAARADELPELWQPREAARGLAAGGGGRGAGRGVRSARHTRRRGQRVLVQRGAERPDLPDARGRVGRQTPRREAGRPSRVRTGGRRDRAARAVRAVGRRVGAVEAAGRPAGWRAAGRRRREDPRSAPGCPGPRPVGSVPQRPRHRRGRRRDRAGGVLHRRRRRGVGGVAAAARSVRGGPRVRVHRVGTAPKPWPGLS